MFRFRCSFQWLVDLSVTCTSVLFQGDWAFIREYNIMECITGIQDLLCILSSFYLISYSYQLTVMGALQCLSLFGSRSLHSWGVHNDCTLGQLFLNLNACCLVFCTHLLFNKSFSICWKLCRPSWSRAVFSGSSFLYFVDDPGDTC